MPYINLIQEQRLGAQANERKARTFFFVFIGSMVASGLAYGFLSMETLLVGRQADAIQAQNKKNEPLVKQIDENGKALADLTPRLKTLEDAAVMTGRWDRILSSLTTQTPQSAWLTGLRCSASDPTKPIQIQFLGVASSQSPIGEFILRLQNQADLDNVNLKFTNEKLIASSKAIEFEVDSDLKGTAEQKVSKEGDSK
ncbi:MAG TPA: PilN domain-containing protein [Fimbriimonadaceae bacterium]|nr:PilN domain-containing protein [Fimbriimonadaceae bacterium]